MKHADCRQQGQVCPFRMSKMSNISSKNKISQCACVLSLVVILHVKNVCVQNKKGPKGQCAQAFYGCLLSTIYHQESESRSFVSLKPQTHSGWRRRRWRHMYLWWWKFPTKNTFCSFCFFTGFYDAVNNQTGFQITWFFLFFSLFFCSKSWNTPPPQFHRRMANM